MPEATRLQAFCCMWGSDGSAAGGRESDLSEWPRSADEEGFSKPTKLPGTATGHKTYNLISMRAWWHGLCHDGGSNCGMHKCLPYVLECYRERRDQRSL